MSQFCAKPATSRYTDTSVLEVEVCLVAYKTKLVQTIVPEARATVVPDSGGGSQAKGSKVKLFADSEAMPDPLFLSCRVMRS